MTNRANQYRQSNYARLRLQFAIIGVLIAMILLYGLIMSAYMAHQFQYSAALGQPLFAGIYQPFAWIVWSFEFYKYDQGIFRDAYLGFAGSTGLILLVGVTLIALKSRRPQAWQGVKGSARWIEDETEVEDMGLLPTKKGEGSGIVIAGFPMKGGGVRYLRHPQTEHIHMIGPTRSGKGVSFVVPAILTWSESMAVIDKKGELYEMTAGYLAANGWRVLRYDPMNPTDSVRFNVLDQIRIGTAHEVGDAMNMATSLVNPQSSGGDSGGNSEFFRSEANRMLAGVILDVIYRRILKGERASLADVALALSDPDQTPKEMFTRMKENLYLMRMEDGSTRPAKAGETGQLCRHDFIAEMGAKNLYDAEAPRQLLAVLGTASQKLFATRDPEISKTLAASDFTIDELMNGEKKVALFIIMPAAPLDQDRLNVVFKTLTLMMLDVPMRKIIKPIAGEKQLPHKRRLMLMLDEIGNLGSLEILEPALSMLAGYGVKVICIWQSVEQITMHYGQNNAVLAGGEMKLSFAPNDLPTAETISNLLGVTTLAVEQTSISGGRFSIGLHQVQQSYDMVERPLLTVDECMKLRSPKKDAQDRITAPGELLVIKRGFNPIKAEQVLYFQVPTLLERVKISRPISADSDNASLGALMAQQQRPATRSTFTTTAEAAK